MNQAGHSKAKFGFRVIVDFVNGSVVCRIQAHQNIRIRRQRKVCKDFLQDLRPQLTGAAKAVGELSEFNIVYI